MEWFSEMAVAQSGAFLPCETMFGGYIDDFVVANKSAMDAYAAKEPMKTEDGHASFQRVAETRVGKVLQPYNPVTRIIGHGILDLPMIGKYVRAGTYLPVTYHHGRCVGKEAQRGACPGMKHPAFAQGRGPTSRSSRTTCARTRRRRPTSRGAATTASDVLAERFQRRAFVFSFPGPGWCVSRIPRRADAAAVDVVSASRGPV